MFNSSDVAIVIISEDSLFVAAIIGKICISELDVLIERAIGLSDFKILLDELLNEGFTEIKVIVDRNISMDEYMEIEKYSNSTHSDKSIKMYQEHDFKILI